VKGPPGSGKTQELIQTAAETGAWIACHDRSECSRLFRLAKAQGTPIEFPITHGDLRRGAFGRVVSAILVDDVGALLRSLCKEAVLGGWSMTAGTAEVLICGVGGGR